MLDQTAQDLSRHTRVLGEFRALCAFLCHSHSECTRSAFVQQSRVHLLFSQCFAAFQLRSATGVLHCTFRAPHASYSVLVLRCRHLHLLLCVALFLATVMLFASKLLADEFNFKLIPI